MHDQELLSEAYEMVYERTYGMAVGAKEITADQIVEEIKKAEQQGAKPISITAVTIPQQSKKNPLFPIYKVSRMNGMIGADYERSVNRQREREEGTPDFQRQSGWGEHVSTSLIQGANGLSVQIQPSPNAKPQPSVFVTGAGGQFRIITPEEKETYIKTPSEEGTAKQQGVERAVVLRRVLINNIAGIVISGVESIVSTLDSTKKEVLRISSIQDKE